MRSPRINGRTSSFCQLHFSFYSKHGSDLHVRLSQDDFSTSLLGESRTAAQWQTIKVDIGPQRPGFSIKISAATRYFDTQYKDVALDNFKFVNCNPNKPVIPDPGNDSWCWSWNIIFKLIIFCISNSRCQQNTH